MKLLITLAGLLPAFVLQAQFADRLFPAMYRPDLVLAVLLAAALFLPSRSLAAASLIAGVLEGVLCGKFMGAFIVSRVVASFVASATAEPLNLNVVVAFVISVLAAIAASVVFLLAEPTPEVVWWLNVAIRQALLTGLLVAAVYPLAALLLARYRVDEE